MLLINFLAVFILMAFLFWKIMNEIRLIKKRVGELEGEKRDEGKGRSN